MLDLEQVRIALEVRSIREMAKRNHSARLAKGWTFEQVDDIAVLPSDVNSDEMIAALTREIEYPMPCIHEYHEVHPSMGDPANPSGKRCGKCNHQVWY